MNSTIHQGRNIKRFGEMPGIKQEGLAYLPGEDWNQQKISTLEQKEIVDTPLLEQVAKLLKVPAAAITNFDKKVAINIVSNTFHNTNGLVNYYPTFNPLEKYMRLSRKIKKLYEQLLQRERVKVVLLERMLSERK